MVLVDLGSMVQIHFEISGFGCFECETWKISPMKIFEVNDLSPRFMMDERSRYSSKLRVSGVSNVKHEKSPGGKSLKWIICCHVSPLMDGLDLLWDFGSSILRDFRMFLLGKLPKWKSSKYMICRRMSWLMNDPYSLRKSGFRKFQMWSMNISRRKII